MSSSRRTSGRIYSPIAKIDRRPLIAFTVSALYSLVRGPGRAFDRDP